MWLCADESVCVSVVGDDVVPGCPVAVRLLFFFSSFSDIHSTLCFFLFFLSQFCRCVFLHVFCFISFVTMLGRSSQK